MIKTMPTLSRASLLKVTTPWKYTQNITSYSLKCEGSVTQNAVVIHNFVINPCVSKAAVEGHLVILRLKVRQEVL